MLYLTIEDQVRDLTCYELEETIIDCDRSMTADAKVMASVESDYLYEDALSHFNKAEAFKLAAEKELNDRMGTEEEKIQTLQESYYEEEEFNDPFDY